MPFDVEGYRKAAKAAGISDSEIENEIKFQTATPEKTDAFEKGPDGFQLGSLQQVQERLGNDWWHLPAGLAVLGAAAYGAEKLMGGSGTPSNTAPAPRIDPTMNGEPVPAPVVTEPVAPAQPDRLQRAAEMIEANRQAGIGQPIAPIAEAPVATPLSAAPIDAPAPTPTAGPNSPVTSIVTDEIKSLMHQADAPVAPVAPAIPPGELRTGTGKPAFAGQGPAPKISKRTGQPQFKPEYASIKDVPAGYAVIPNAQYADVLRSIGQPEYLEAFSRRDFPTTYEQAVQATRDINRELGRPTRAEAKAAGTPYGDNVPGITKKTTANTKLVSVGGKAGFTGALVALADVANAKTAGERGLAGANVLEAVLPPTMMIGGAGEGSSTVPSQDPALLLGSPYAFSEAGKKFRQDQAYTRKVGAGRGFAPPSAYRR
jgi:hypothetical protein